MSNKIDKLIIGKEKEFIKSGIVIGKGRLYAGSSLEEKVDETLEEEYGEEYTEARDKFLEEVEISTRKFTDIISKLMTKNNSRMCVNNIPKSEEEMIETLKTLKELLEKTVQRMKD